MKLFEQKFKQFLTENQDNNNDLFQFWKNGELDAGNNSIENATTPEELDDEAKETYDHYIKLVKYYPEEDKEDLAVLNSIALYGGVGLNYNEYEWNSLTKSQFYKIMREMGILDEGENIEESEGGKNEDLSLKWNWKEEGDEPHSIFDDILDLYNSLEDNNKEEFKKDITNFTNHLR